MATLDYLLEKGFLVRHDASLEHDEQPVRYVYYPDGFRDWVSNVLQPAPRDRSRNLTPLEQVEQALFDFVIGRPVVYGWHCKKLMPRKHDVWELRTEDVRLFGWAPRKGSFIVVCGELKKRLKRAEDYTPFIEWTRTFRDNLDIESPKALTGDNPYDVF